MEQLLKFVGPVLGWLKDKSDGNPKSSAAVVGAGYSFFDPAPWDAFWKGVANFANYMTTIF